MARARSTAWALAVAAIPAGLTAPLAAQTLDVSPVSRADFEGSSSTTYPLGRHNMRLQTLHADLPASMTTIHGHAYRRDAIATRGQVAGFSVDIEVQMSVAQTTPDNPSATFAQNRGPAPVTVLPRTTISFPPTQRPGTLPAPTFELLIPYTQPFTRPAGAVVCMEVIVYGNQAPSGANRNFTPYLDAHELAADGSHAVAGFRYGSGCTANGGSASMSGVFELVRDPSDLELQIAGRNTVPGGQVAAFFGLAPSSVSLPFAPGCTLATDVLAIVDLGTSDAGGNITATLPGLATMPTGLRFFAQLASGDLTTGDLAVSEGSELLVAPLDPAPIMACRIAAGSDRDATTGATSFNVPVTMFF